MNIQKYFVCEEQEVHIIDNSKFVTVCWNIEMKKETTEKDGIIYSVMTPIREGKPYINFISLAKFESQSYINKRNTVEGGLSLSNTLIVIEELKKACDYIKTM